MHLINKIDCKNKLVMCAISCIDIGSRVYMIWHLRDPRFGFWILIERDQQKTKINGSRTRDRIFDVFRCGANRIRDNVRFRALESILAEFSWTLHNFCFFDQKVHFFSKFQIWSIDPMCGRENVLIYSWSGKPFSNRRLANHIFCNPLNRSNRGYFCVWKSCKSD